MRYRKVIAGATCAAVAAVALSACGSSSSNSSTSAAASSAAASSATPASTPSGSAIVVGSICSCSGAQAAALARVGDVSTVWAKSVNASGGINGHPVKMIVKDDGGSPSAALQAVKELVQTDHVMAIVGDGSLADNSWASYVASTGVPVVGGFSPSIPFLTNPDFFANGATLPVQTVGVFALAKQAGRKKVGVMYCTETPLCAQLIPIAKGAAALTGVGVTSVAVSGTAPSYAAPCLAMKSAGVDSLFIADNAAIVGRIVAACAQQGYKPLTVSETTTADSSWLTNASFDGAQLASSNANYTDSSLPGVQTFLSAINKYAPGLSSGAQFSYDTFYPWLAGSLFSAAAKAAHIGPTSTPADVKKGLYALKNETLGGLSAPLNFAPGKPAFATCYYGVTIKGSKFGSLNGGKATCLTAAQAAGLAAGLKKLVP